MKSLCFLHGRYKGELEENGAFKSAAKAGIESKTYTQLIHSLCLELKKSLGLGESVTLPQGKEDAESFQLELRAFLGEMKCPHSSLTSSMEVLESYHKKLLLCDYLLSEVMASRLVSSDGEEAMEVNGGEVSCLMSSLHSCNRITRSRGQAL